MRSLCSSSIDLPRFPEGACGEGETTRHQMSPNVRPEGCIGMYGVTMYALQGGRDEASQSDVWLCTGGRRGQSSPRENRLQGHEKRLTHRGMVRGRITNADMML